MRDLRCPRVHVTQLPFEPALYPQSWVFSFFFDSSYQECYSMLMKERTINSSELSIKQILFAKKRIEDKIIEVSNIIYTLLTTRTSFEELIQNWILPEDILKRYPLQSDWYRNKWQEWEATEDGDGNPWWIQINCHLWGSKEKNTTNIKIYRTISVENYWFIAYLGSLRNRLKEISQDSWDKISLKFPRGLVWFLKHRDSLVIHFALKENIDLINQAINDWMNEYKIIPAERELWRTTIAADHSWKSFSELVAEYFAYQMIQNPNKILSLLNKAIISSQKRNF